MSTWKTSVRDPEKMKPLGLGDLVGKVARPIAKAADAVLGTDLANCPGCEKRKAGLNEKVRNIKKPFEK